MPNYSINSICYNSRVENKHIAAICGVGLVILLIVLFLFHSNKTPNTGADNPLNSGLNQALLTPLAATPTPIIISQLSGQDINIGTGSAVVAGDNVTVNYIGALTDGRVFDSSLARHQPFTFQIGSNGIIEGFQEGIVGMKLGGKRKIFIPANLGYGDKAQGSIPANSGLIFDVELIDIQVPATPTPSPSPTPTPTDIPSSQ